MRMFTHVIIIASTTLLTLSVHAAPAHSSDDIDKLIGEKDLVGHIGQVRQRVTDQASELVLNAMNLLGVPYRRGGNSADTGFDCSGFVRAMYQQTIGLLLPRRAEQQAAATQNIARDDLQPGDLVFFNTMRRAFSHVGIYVGDGKFIHSPRSGSEVRVDSMSQYYWNRRFDGARRVAAKPETAAAAVAQAQALLSAAPLPQLP